MFMTYEDFMELNHQKMFNPKRIEYRVIDTDKNNFTAKLKDKEGHTAVLEVEQMIEFIYRAKDGKVITNPSALKSMYEVYQIKLMKHSFFKYVYDNHGLAVDSGVTWGKIESDFLTAYRKLKREQGYDTKKAYVVASERTLKDYEAKGVLKVVIEGIERVN